MAEGAGPWRRVWTLRVKAQDSSTGGGGGCPGQSGDDAQRLLTSVWLVLCSPCSCLRQKSRLGFGSLLQRLHDNKDRGRAKKSWRRNRVWSGKDRKDGDVCVGEMTGARAHFGWDLKTFQGSGLEMTEGSKEGSGEGGRGQGWKAFCLNDSLLGGKPGPH